MFHNKKKSKPIKEGLLANGQPLGHLHDNSEIRWLDPVRWDHLTFWTTACGRYRIWRSVGSGISNRFVAEYRLAAEPEKLCWRYLTKTENYQGYYPKEFRTLSSAMLTIFDFHCQTQKVTDVKTNMDDAIVRAHADGLATLGEPIGEPTKTGKIKKGASVVAITRERAIGVLKALGYQTADRWSDDRMASTFREVPECEDFPEKIEALDGSIREDLDSVLRDVKSGKSLKFTTTEDTVTSMTSTTKESKKPKHKDRPEKHPEKYQENREKHEKRPEKASNVVKSKSAASSGPREGVVSTIIEVLKKASARSPVTTAEIVKVLAKKFPDRDPIKMTNSVRVQLYSVIESRTGMQVHRNDVRGEDRGFWIESK